MTPSGVGERRLYGESTIPLQVRRDPRRRLIGVVLGFAAASLEVISAPLAIQYLAVSNGISISDVLLLSGVSLIATLWTFQSIGFAAVGSYASALVLRKKAQAGAGWIVLGIFAVSIAALFLFIAGLLSAWVGIAAGSLVIVAAVLNIL